jgi:phosphoribosylaminoimidazole (AIR) synthetase
VLTSSIVGVVDRDAIIDGSRVAPGDVAIGLEASGPHTNGYTLIRRLLADNPTLGACRGNAWVIKIRTQGIDNALRV